MFPSRYYPTRYYPTRYFPHQADVTAVTPVTIISRQLKVLRTHGVGGAVIKRTLTKILRVGE